MIRTYTLNAVGQEHIETQACMQNNWTYDGRIMHSFIHLPFKKHIKLYKIYCITSSSLSAAQNAPSEGKAALSVDS